jgi:hypothetical protein
VLYFSSNDILQKLPFYNIFQKQGKGPNLIGASFASATDVRIVAMFVKFMVVSRKQYSVKSCKFLEDFDRNV